MKYVISSHKDYIGKTENIIVNSLLNSKVNIKDIFIFVGGYDPSVGYTIIPSSVSKFTSPHNSFDFTGLISVIEMNIDYDYWFLLHDTVYVGPDFHKKVMEFNHKNIDYVALTHDTSMNMGSYSWSYIQKKKNEILSYKNVDGDLQSYKNRLIRDEDIFLKPKFHSYSKVYRETSSPIDFFDNNTKRIIEHFPDIDLYKVKANWLGYNRSEYILKL